MIIKTTKSRITAFSLVVIMIFLMFALGLAPLHTVSAEAPPIAGANGFIAEIDRNVQYDAMYTSYISTAEQLMEIGKEQSAGRYYVLTNDIHLTEEWGPISDFQGTFDGQGYTINNLYVLKNSNQQYAELFAKATNATIKNLGVNIGLLGVSSNTWYSSYSGGLIGYSNSGTIINCYAIGLIFSTSSNTSNDSNFAAAGGLIGYSDGSIIIDCYATGESSSSSEYTNSSAGGLVGRYSGVIMNSYATSTVSSQPPRVGSSYAGGLIGYCNDGINTITDCYAIGSVSSSSSASSTYNGSSYAGGLVGRNGSSTIANCYATGSISSYSSHTYSYAGGIAGISDSSKITNCYATGTVYSSSSNSPFAGGLIGYCNKGLFTITNCYTTGNITSEGSGSKNYVGRLIGYSGSSSITLLNGNHITQKTIGDTLDPLGEPISFWAVEGVFSAVKDNLVPENLQNSFGNDITRAEFAALAVTLYEKVLGTIKIVRTELRTFIDTDDENVEKAASIGVVLGVGENMFAPDSSLTREQAAVMLTRLADVIGKTLPSVEATFADNSLISDWAIDGVGRIQAAGIMQGVGENMFAPKSPYTREQSILTMVRLYNNEISSVSPITIKGKQYDVSAVELNLLNIELTTTDIEPLKYMTNLTMLNLGNNQINDIIVLHELTSLTCLELGNNQIIDIKALGELTNLTRLELGSFVYNSVLPKGNQIIDISPLRQLSNLEYLDLGDNQINDINVLKNLGKLTSLVLWGNPIDEEQIKELQEALPNCNISSVDIRSWS
jgi:Leucine-rich repeat (LRR) protein